MRLVTRPGSILLTALTTLAALVLATGCGDDAAKTGTGTSPMDAPKAPGLAQLEREYEQVVKAVLPSVVLINTDTGLGSGVIYDNKGDIVTNAHVVAGARKLNVTTATGKKAISAKLVGEYPPDDLAVIRVTDRSLKPAVFGDSNKLVVGQIVLAMGNPLGLSGSVSNGIVSAVGRTVSSQAEGAFPGATIPGTIQTSAAINPGNSGGALVTLNGRVVGIPSLSATDPSMGGTAAGIGFAIPSNTVKLIADQLISSGKVTNSGRAALGVQVRSVTDLQGNVVGVGVVSVNKGGPAQKAGIQPGDVITAINGTKLTTTTALAQLLAGRKPGESVKVDVQHPNGRRSTVNVKLGELPG